MLAQTPCSFTNTLINPFSTTADRDMPTSHAGLNINEEDFLRANEDTLKALEENGIGEAEKNEVIAILNSMKGDVISK